MESKRLTSLLFLAPALALDLAAFRYLWSAQPAHPAAAGPGILLHFCSVLLWVPAFLFMLPPAYRSEKILSSLLIAGFCLPLPLLGPFLFFAFILLVLRIKPAPKPQEAYVFGDQKYLTSSDRYELNVKEGTRSVLEIINSPDKAARRKAIVAMRLVEPKKAIPILRRALQDSDDEVRIYAQGVLSKIIESLETSLKQAELRKPEEVDELLRLAEQYHEFIYLDLVGEESQGAYLAKAIHGLERARQLEPRNQQVLLLLVKCYLKMKNVSAAKSCLQFIKESNPEADFTIPWEMEVLYYERDWRALESLLKELSSKRWANTKLKTLFNFWLSPPERALKT